MKKTIIYIFIIAAIAGATSCIDLDQMPRYEISDPSFWKIPDDFEQAANALFFGLDAFPSNGEAETMSGLHINTVSNGTHIASANDGVWDDSYAYIRKANNILQKYEECNIKEDAKASKGEALFFRAYYYFKLYKRFGETPIIKDVLDVNSPGLTASRDKRTDVEDFILSDIDEAINYLPDDVPDDKKGRITKGIALAFKSRVALFIGTWGKYHSTRTDYKDILEKAADAAEKVITGSGTDGKKYDLYKAYGIDSYRYLFIEEGDDSPESILDNRYYYKIRTHGNTYGWAWGTNGFPTKKFADMYLCDDGLPIDKSPRFQKYQTVLSEYQNRDPRMELTLLKPTESYITSEMQSPSTVPYNFSERPETKSGYRLHKFIGEKFYESVGSGPCEYDCHIIRYAEVLLNYAEAKFEKDDNISDADLDMTINELRRRVLWDVKLTNGFVNSNNLDMKTEIRRERNVELAFEGFRYDDLRRWKTAEAEMPESLRGVKVKGTEWESKLAPETLASLKFDSEGFVVVEDASKRTFDAQKHYLFSLPLQQIQMNPNLRPNNPGWE